MKAIAKGIDVSKWQGAIDWKKVKASGIEFAMIRLSYSREIDRLFETNYKNARAAKMPIGAYVYSMADSIEEAQAEADFVAKTLKGKQFEYPIAFDIEDNSLKKHSKKELTNITKAFCEAVTKAGFYVCIYTNLDWARNYLDMKALSSFDVWIAQWNSKCTYTGDYGMWQYADNGKVDGISGNVDLDKAYKDYPAIIKKAGLNGFKKSSSSEKPKTEQNKPTSSTNEKKPSNYPESFDSKYKNGKSFKVSAVSGLRLRKAAVDGATITVMPYNSKVTWYGYYTKKNNVMWKYVQYIHNGKKYEGFCSSQYLK